VTTDINGNSLAVDYYDFYYTFGLAPYAPVPHGLVLLHHFVHTVYPNHRTTS
jgi:hypothetical protein